MTSPTSSTLILSDLHLGRPGHGAGSADAVRPLWQGCSHLILNGDIAEIHHPVHRAGAAREMFTLIEYCDQDGVDVMLLSGNHDPFISDHRALELADGEIFITHGDVFHPAVAPWSPNAQHIRRANDLANRVLQPEIACNLERRLRASQHASAAEWEEMDRQAGHSTVASLLLRPWAVVQVLLYWHRFPKIVARFADEHNLAATYIITGHTHREGTWNVGERVIINTGSFGFPGHPRAVLIKERVLSVFAIEMNDKPGSTSHYQLAQEPQDSFPLSRAQAASPAAAHPPATPTRDDTGRPTAVAM